MKYSVQRGKSRESLWDWIGTKRLRVVFVLLNIMCEKMHLMPRNLLMAQRLLLAYF